MKKRLSVLLALAMVITLFISILPINASAAVNSTTGTVFNSCDKEITSIPTATNVPGASSGDGGTYAGSYQLNTEDKVEGAGCYQVSGTEAKDYVRLYIPYGDANVDSNVGPYLLNSMSGSQDDYGLQLWIYSDDFTTLQSDSNFKVILGCSNTPEVDCYFNMRWYLKTDTTDNYQDYALQNGKWNLVVLPISLSNVNENFVSSQLNQVMIGFSSNVTLSVDDLRIVRLADVGVDNVYSTDANKYVLETRDKGVASAAELTFDPAVDASGIANRDAALLTWIYADGLDAMNAAEGGLNLRITSDGKTAAQAMSWNLGNYKLTDKKWNLVALPFKESADSGLNRASIDYLQVTIGKMPANAKVEVKDAQIINFTKYLYDNTGIIFYDGYEKPTMLWSDLSTDSVYGASSVILKNNFANECMHVAEYKQPNVTYPILTDDTPLDFSAAGNASNLDLYYSVKLVGDVSNIKCDLRFSISSYAKGNYLDETSLHFLLQDKSKLSDGEWHRVSNSDDSLEWEQKAQGIDLSKIKNMRFFIENTDGSYQYLVDNLMFVNHKTYGGTEDIYIVKTTDYDGSNVAENYKLKTVTDDTTTKQTTTTTIKNTTTTAKTTPSDTTAKSTTSVNKDSSPVTGESVTLSVLVIALLAGASLIVCKKKMVK